MSEHTHENAALEKDLAAAARIIQAIQDEVGKEVIGQQQLQNRLILSLITQGHILLEGVPGLAKTLSVKALANAVQAKYQRIQFTPDLLPADLIGTEIFRPQDGSFEVRKGPIFANFVLADEINRAPAKVQSALLETMQEKQVTIGETTLKVPDPFFVMATQNPIEQEGTYPLPEAQIDRFIMKVKVDYPDPSDEKKLLDLLTTQEAQRMSSSPTASLSEITYLNELSHSIYVDQRIREYIVNLVGATREPSKHGLKVDSLIELGASPRAVISLFLIARAAALVAGQQYVVPQLIKDVAPDVLRHRILLTYEAEAQGIDSDDIVQMILSGVEVP